MKNNTLKQLIRYIKQIDKWPGITLQKAYFKNQYIYIWILNYKFSLTFLFELVFDIMILFDDISSNVSKCKY